VARVLTWNVAGRVRTAAAQLALVSDDAADVVCLQEITPTSRDTWVEGLEAAGYQVVVSPYVADPQGSRRLTTLIAGRAPVEPAPDVPGLPWPERHLAVRTAVDGNPTEVHTLHAPLSQKPDRVKVRTLEALYDAVARDDGVARIVTGDLNTPAYESREGAIQTFARTRSGRIRPDYGERHDRAELLLVGALPRDHGWSDAFRALHGYSARDRSYMFVNRKFGWRLDHILLSPEFDPVACEYLHAWREQGLSDHSAMWADVRPRPPGSL
jgi:exonuclease III